MTTVADWVKQETVTTGTGPVTVSGSLVGFATLKQALGSGVTSDLAYSIESGNGTDKEAGIGSYDGTAEVLTRSTIHTTLVGGVYDDTSPTAINLSGTSIVRVTFNSEGFRQKIDQSPTDNASYFRNGSVPEWTKILKDYQEEDQVLAGSGSYAIDISNGQVALCTVTGGVTFTSFGTPDPKRSFTLHISMASASAVQFPADSNWGDQSAPVFDNGKDYLIGVFGNLAGTEWNMLLGNSY